MSCLHFAAPKTYQLLYIFFVLIRQYDLILGENTKSIKTGRGQVVTLFRNWDFKSAQQLSTRESTTVYRLWRTFKSEAIPSRGALR